MSVIKPENGFFPITSVHRADLEDIGFDVTDVTDERMLVLAQLMEEVYVGSGAFWDHLEGIAEEVMGLLTSGPSERSSKEGKMDNERVVFGTPWLNEFCCECGRSVKPGSGLFANRVPEGNSVVVRAEMGRSYPEGDFVCVECDGMTSED